MKANYKGKAVALNFIHFGILVLAGKFASVVNWYFALAILWGAFLIHGWSYGYAKKYWLWKNGKE